MLRALACLAFALLVSAPASAQGRVTGLVMDLEGRPIKAHPANANARAALGRLARQ